VSSKPTATVVTVADYAPGEDRGWDILRNALHALAKQDFDEPAQFMVVEQSKYADRIPDDLVGILPGLEILVVDAPSPHALKNAAVQAASADIIAFLDADCVPDPGWLRGAVETLRTHPEVSAVSGRTRYPGSNLLQRVLSLCDRAFLDSGRTRPTTTISNNNSAFRRDAYIEHPLREEMSFYAGRAQAQSLERPGHRLLFEPRMVARHLWDGWEMEREYRKQVGYGVIALRRADPKSRFTRILKLGPVTIPAVVAYRIVRRWIEVCRSAPHHDVTWYELPIALLAAIGLHLLEIPGMWAAFREKPFASPLYR
jgi:glycosyltransferase involved in cell wall biosynthesis